MWHNSRLATRLGRFTRFTLWHDGRQATTQLDRFTLCGTTASELHNSVDLLCGTTATKLHVSVDLLCGTMAAELHNLVDLLCTMATELNNLLSLTHAPGVTHIFQRQWQTVRKNNEVLIQSKILFGVLNALEDSRNTFRDFQQTLEICMLYEDINSRPQQTFERWTLRTHESPRELAHQSEAKCKQLPQSEVEVCRHKCSLEKTSLINCTGHPIMHRTPNTNWGLCSCTSNTISFWASWDGLVEKRKT